MYGARLNPSPYILFTLRGFTMIEIKEGESHFSVGENRCIGSVDILVDDVVVANIPDAKMIRNATHRGRGEELEFFFTTSPFITVFQERATTSTQILFNTTDLVGVKEGGKEEFLTFIYENFGEIANSKLRISIPVRPHKDFTPPPPEGFTVPEVMVITPKGVKLKGMESLLELDPQRGPYVSEVGTKMIKATWGVDSYGFNVISLTLDTKGWVELKKVFKGN